MAGHCLGLKAAQRLPARGPSQKMEEGQVLASKDGGRYQAKRMGSKYTTEYYLESKYTTEYYSAIKRSAVCREIVRPSKI